MQGSQTVIFTFPLKVVMIPVAAALVCLVLAILFFRKRGIRAIGFIFLFLALMAGGLIAPMMFTDRVTVTPQDISATKGFWLNRWKEGFAYEDVEMIEMTSSRTSGGRWTATWQLHYRDGRTQQIVLGDLWRSNEDRIKTLIDSHLNGRIKTLVGDAGVTFVDDRDNRPSYFGADAIRLIVMAVIVIAWLAIYFWFRRYSRKAAAASPPQAAQKQITLFKFDLPEIAALPEIQREKVIAAFSTNQAIQTAINHLWNRPLQWAMGPCAIIVVYGAIKDIGFGHILLWCVPITLAVFLLVRPWYKRKLIQTIQREVRAEIARTQSTLS